MAVYAGAVSPFLASAAESRPPSVDAPAAAATDAAPYRQVARLSIDYVLRVLGLICEVTGEDLVDAVLFLAISRGNVRGAIQDGEAEGRYRTLDDLPPDEMREPVSIYAVARQLGLPYETARRRVNRLIANGLCLRDAAGGLVIPASVYQRPEAGRVTYQNWDAAQDLLDRLLAAGMEPGARRKP
jgi:hypothetical protein